MTQRQDYGPISDQDLVAYLDGMLDDTSMDHVERELAKDRDLEQRLAVLRAGDHDFAGAFEGLLEQAPRSRLESILDEVLNPPAEVIPMPEAVESLEDDAASSSDEPSVVPFERKQAPPRQVHAPWKGWRMLAAAAVLIAAFGGGILLGPLLQTSSQTVATLPPAKGWRAAVAEYQALFIRDTLANAGYYEHARQAGLQSAKSYIGLPLSAEAVAVPSLEFKATGILQFKGKPLVQLAYLHDDKTPVSICIIKNGKPAHAIQSEERLGMNIAHWQAGGYGFMVVGDISAETAQKIAETVKDRLS